MVEAFLSHLLKLPEAYLINTSSMGSYLPVPGQSIYKALKAAAKLLTEDLYAELRQTMQQILLQKKMKELLILVTFNKNIFFLQPITVLR